MQPTEAGLVLYRHVRAIVEQVEVARREVKGPAAEPSGEVRLGRPSSICRILGVPLVLAARERHPQISLRIAEAMSGYVLDWLRLGRVDLGLLYAAAEDRGLRSTGLLTETLVLVGPAEPTGIAEPAGEAVAFAELAALPLILPGPGHGLRDLVRQSATARGVQLTTLLEIDAFDAIRDLVVRGLGYSVLPAHVVWRELEDGRLRSWTLDPPLLRTVHLVGPSDRPSSHAAKAVESLCREVLQELVCSGAWHLARIKTGP